MKTLWPFPLSLNKLQGNWTYKAKKKKKKKKKKKQSTECQHLRRAGAHSGKGKDPGHVLFVNTNLPSRLEEDQSN